MARVWRIWSWLVLGCVAAGPLAAETEFRSHAPLRSVVPNSGRARATGPARFVSVKNGDDAADGTEAAPWKTVNHALRRLRPGDTLYLRAGIYYEHVYCAVRGRAEAPITIRSYPGEAATLDGGFAEFLDAPATAWEPDPTGVAGEFRSTRAYPNLRNVLAWFGDSLVGLSTYFHRRDLQATSELIDWEDWDRIQDVDIRPLYCGPGVWYDGDTGRIHVRLAPTKLAGMDNYAGETDPRRLPFVLAPFHSVPLALDGADHVRFQDLTIRGAGYQTVTLDHATNVELDNVTIWSGAYGIQAARTGPLKIVNCGFHGSDPPWLFRQDASKRTYPGRPHRDITRLNTHAHIVTEAGREFSVYASPVNDNWEIAHCEFADAHDGLYLGGVSTRFHHNLVHELQDDGIYLSQMYPRHIFGGGGAEIQIYENCFRGCLTALAFGGSEPVTRDQISIYRNIIDLRDPIATGRPSTRQPQPSFSTGKPMGDHGSPPWPSMKIYHNTFIMAEASRTCDMALTGAGTTDRPRQFFNNILLHLAALPPLMVHPLDQGRSDGNLYWSPAVDEAQAAMYFQKYRSSPAFEESKAAYPPGLTSHSIVADPRFKLVSAEKKSELPDYRLEPGSAAVDTGAVLPADWPDTLRSADAGAPDIGALPLGAVAPQFGRLKPATEK